VTGPIKRIMIVDNYEAERRGIRSLLDGTRYQVVAEASDARSALDLARMKAPDIAILDFNLPGPNGLEAVTQLKRASPAMEALIYSVPLGDHALVQILRAGIRGYVSKADPGPELVKALDALSVRLVHYSKAAAEELVNRVLAGKRIGPMGILSERELEILKLVGEGWLSREIAAQLGISRKTAEAHRIKMMQKLNCKNTADLVRYAVRNNVVRP
jgi:DNA-binding NarL/FixJ family response regulator